MKKNIKTSLTALGTGIGLVLASATVTPAFAVATLPPTDSMYIISCSPSYDDLTLLSVTSDGTATKIGDGNGDLGVRCPKGAAWDAANQQAYFLTEDSADGQLELWNMDVNTGTPTLTTDVTGSNGNGRGFYIDFNSAGAAQTQYDGKFYNLDLSSGVETFVTSSEVNPNNGFYYVVQAFNFANDTLYGINADNTEDDVTPIPNMLYTVDPAAGVLYGNSGPVISGVSNVGLIHALAFDSSGTGWAIVDGDLYSFDVETATFTLQGTITSESNPGARYALFITQPLPSRELPNTGLNPSVGMTAFVLLSFSGVIALVLRRRRRVA